MNKCAIARSVLLAFPFWGDSIYSAEKFDPEELVGELRAMIERGEEDRRQFNAFLAQCLELWIRIFRGDETQTEAQKLEELIEAAENSQERKRGTPSFRCSWM
jgi:hypothetical protein